MRRAAELAVMDEQSTRDMALAAKAKIDAHVEECAKTSTRLADEMTAFHTSNDAWHARLFSKIEELETKFAGRWWTILLIVVCGLGTVCAALLVYIWERHG